jgi:hypothetical protein
VSAGQEQLDGVGADVAGAASDENAHAKIIAGAGAPKTYRRTASRATISASCDVSDNLSKTGNEQCHVHYGSDWLAALYS